MEIELLKEVLECLNDGRKLVHYHKDKYAFYLLESYCRSIADDKGWVKISDIKASPFAKLLQRQLVKRLVAQSGHGKIFIADLEDQILEEYQSYVITLSQWGSKADYPWEQTSRPGSNLVMQLNLTNQHDQHLLKLKIDSEVFKTRFHPIHQHKSSLAWVRIDFDFDTGEALIEEIQTDWIRRAATHKAWAKKAVSRGAKYYRVYDKKYPANEMLEYTEMLLQKHKNAWQEVSLFCAIQLIQQDIGISNIFYHSYETGAVIKNIRESLPPKSLYTDLPKQFCFKVVDKGPEFVINNKNVKRRLKKLKQVKWFQLCI